MNRSDYLNFHKQIALMHLQSLSLGACFDVLIASLKAHKELRKHEGLKRGIAAMFRGEIDTLEKLENFIHSLN